MNSSICIPENVSGKGLSSMTARWLCCLAAIATGTVLSPSALVADNTNLVEKPASHFTSMTLEQLSSIEVTSVSKRPEKYSEAAAAIFVITQEDLRRSGVTSIPEALRMVPGLEVAQLDAHEWAITSRGFNDVFANKLLVLIDGRSVYTPLFSGVNWDVQDTLLEDIERIEVIRGPGASLWGANAVNGVINIITKSAKDTQGALVSGGIGTEEQGFGAARFGDKIGSNLFFRAYAKYFNRDDAAVQGGGDAADEWDVARGGFRMDWEPVHANSFTLQGDGYSGNVGQRLTLPLLVAPFSKVKTGDTEIQGANVLGRWTHRSDETGEFAIQSYFDRTERTSSNLSEVRDTADVDFQHRFTLLKRQSIVWGLGYRVMMDDLQNSFQSSFHPNARQRQLFSAFVQDEITLVDNRLRLTFGSKFEHNDSTGYEIQPSGRLLWTPNDNHTLWTAVSRAVRTPSRAEDDVRVNNVVVPGAPPIVGALFGNRDFDSEEMIAYEFGYRTQPADWLLFDVALFYNVYNNLRTIEAGALFVENTPAPPHLVAPFSADNKMNGETYGVEVASQWSVLSWWRLIGAYTFLDMQLHLDNGSTDTTSEAAEGSIPNHQFSLRSQMDLPWNLELDAMLRSVENLPALNVPSYVTLDIRLGWRPNKNWEFAIVGQNLLDDQHPEFKPSFVPVQPTEVQRSVYGKVTWRF